MAKQTVYYDGACPLCSREIAFYRRRKGADSIDWVDASQCVQADFGPGLDRESALARMHVRDGQGQLTEGATSFLAIWRQLPAFAWLASVLDNPVGRSLMETGYRLFLKIRPALIKRAAKTSGR